MQRSKRRMTIVYLPIIYFSFFRNGGELQYSQISGAVENPRHGHSQWSPDRWLMAWSPQNGVRMTAGHFCTDWTWPDVADSWKVVRAGGSGYFLEIFFLSELVDMSVAFPTSHLQYTYTSESSSTSVVEWWWHLPNGDKGLGNLKSRITEFEMRWWYTMYGPGVWPMFAEPIAREVIESKPMERKKKKRMATHLCHGFPSLLLLV